MKNILNIILAVVICLWSFTAQADQTCNYATGAPLLATDVFTVSKNCAGTRKITAAELLTYAGGGTPSQTGNNGKYLTTNGTAASWATLTSSTIGLGSVENAAASGLYVPLTRTINGHALSANTSVTASDLSLGSVENTALSTWAGTANITTLGTIATGVWNAGAVASSGAITSSTEQTDEHMWLGSEFVFAKSAGTWTQTRIAQADYGLVHTASTTAAILSIDITNEIRTTASKGFKLTTIDVSFKNITANMDAHSATLDKVCSANNAANVVTSVPITGTLHTATQANPYLDTLTVTSPAYLNTADCHYILEITADAAATSAYTFYGVSLNFSANRL